MAEGMLNFKMGGKTERNLSPDAARDALYQKYGADGAEERLEAANEILKYATEKDVQFLERTGLVNSVHIVDALFSAKTRRENLETKRAEAQGPMLDFRGMEHGAKQHHNAEMKELVTQAIHQGITQDIAEHGPMDEHSMAMDVKERQAAEGEGEAE
jgi:hypothetical protein